MTSETDYQLRQLPPGELVRRLRAAEARAAAAEESLRAVRAELREERERSRLVTGLAMSLESVRHDAATLRAARVLTGGNT